MRIGHGYDVHRLVEDRLLILGGVNIPFEKGLLGHSDADVLTHALMDAMLGAAGLGDIGKHFPDTDPQYKGADSLKLLSHVSELIKDHGFVLGNADITLVAQRPKVGGYMPEMIGNLAKAIGCEASRLNIKATTEEKLGFTGEGAGVACHAVCLLEEYG
jgi:2-C-methyl-D-erythritol 2,4-cyclodiphosphate synthase